MPAVVDKQELKACLDRSLDELAMQLMVSGPASVKAEAFETLRGYAAEAGNRALAEAAGVLAQRVRTEAAGKSDAELGWLRSGIGNLADLIHHVASVEEPEEDAVPAAPTTTSA